jgi:hypothetical protein
MHKCAGSSLVTRIKRTAILHDPNAKWLFWEWMKFGQHGVLLGE